MTGSKTKTYSPVLPNFMTCRAAPANDVGKTPSPRDRSSRLRRALADMEEAQNELLMNVDTFKGEIDRLGDRMDKLGRNMDRYQTALGNIRIERITAKSRRLSRIMGNFAVA